MHVAVLHFGNTYVEALSSPVAANIWMFPVASSFSIEAHTQ